MIFINTLLILVAIYLLLGFAFAIAFVSKGITRIDEGAHGSKWGFRVITIPGVIVFWPFLLKKWIDVSKKVNDD
jgi:hypothetical protein